MVASQELKSTGRSWSASGMTYARWYACQARLAPPKPPSLHSPAKTGVVNDSPGPRRSRPESSYPAPPVICTRASESWATEMRQEPDQPSAQP
uniref:Uncharacterized protein n=1 Tax=Streptomyces avermitilis TaxID=33903 RepID=A0A499VIG5_STRAX|nr:hypothetical protein SAVMC3_19600 [Streptomyces avermitilis]